MSTALTTKRWRHQTHDRLGGIYLTDFGNESNHNVKTRKKYKEDEELSKSDDSDSSVWMERIWAFHRAYDRRTKTVSGEHFTRVVPAVTSYQTPRRTRNCATLRLEAKIGVVLQIVLWQVMVVLKQNNVLKPNLKPARTK